jgi:flavin reductase (DIM6/NTAB) family NADH-FMN oxidoreductase RutF
MNTSREELIEAFEAGEVDNTGFSHADHVHVAWILAHRYPPEDAYRRLVAGIRGIAQRAGRPAAYHETITRAWFELISEVDDLSQHPELLDARLLGRYYSVQRLAAGREVWLEPDLHPLRLPPPLAVGWDLRRVMSVIPTSVAVLAIRSTDTVHATTVSSLASVSLEPPLVSVCLSNESRMLELVRDAKAFALSVLASDQDPVASRFADSRAPGAGQFSGLPHHMGPFGPVIEGAAAWIGCSVEGMQKWGDHHIVIGHVSHAEAIGRRPIVRHDGAYH